MKLMYGIFRSFIVMIWPLPALICWIHEFTIFGICVSFAAVFLWQPMNADLNLVLSSWIHWCSYMFTVCCQVSFLCQILVWWHHNCISKVLFYGGLWRTNRFLLLAERSSELGVKLSCLTHSDISVFRPEEFCHGSYPFWSFLEKKVEKSLFMSLKL